MSQNIDEIDILPLWAIAAAKCLDKSAGYAAANALLDSDKTKQEIAEASGEPASTVSNWIDCANVIGLVTPQAELVDGEAVKKWSLDTTYLPPDALNTIKSRGKQPRKRHDDHADVAKSETSHWHDETDILRDLGVESCSIDYSYYHEYTGENPCTPSKD